MPQLLCDILSSCTGKVYGHTGDEVTIIDQEGPVCIVEDKEGKRFPVLKHKLVTAAIPVVKPEPKQEEKIIVKPVQVAARSPRAKPVPINQLLLF